jgi:hypothetical protein
MSKMQSAQHHGNRALKRFKLTDWIRIKGRSTQLPNMYKSWLYEIGETIRR